MVRKLVRWVMEGQGWHPAIDARGRQLVASMLWATIILSPPYALFLIVHEPNRLTHWVVGLAAFELVGWIGVWLLLRNKVRAAAYELHIGFLLVLMAATLLGGEMGPFGYLGGTLLVVSAGLLAGGLAAGTLGAILLGWACLIYLLSAWDLLSTPTTYSSIEFAIGAAGVFLVLTVLLGVVWRSQRRAFSKIARELVERRETERSAAESERQTRTTLSLLRATLESTADGLLVVDQHGATSSWNQRFVDLWGIPPAMMELGNDEDLLQFVTGQLAEPESFLGKVRQLYATPDSVSFDILRFRDGRVFERYSQPQQLEGKTVGRVWSFRDVTERIQSAEQLRSMQVQLFQAQKMEAMGTLAGGIAHDFNNLLAAIGSHVDLARMAPAGERIDESLSEIQQAVLRARDLVHQILLYSKGGVEDRERISLNALVLDTAKLLHAMIPRAVEVVAEPHPSNIEVIGHKGQLQQVLMNLGINAWRALEDQQGQIRIRVAMEPDASGKAEAIIAVSDTGIGMPPEMLSRIFEPFFSTRPHGEGTGLGLAMATRIARDHLGEMTVESTVGVGSVFRLHLPLASAVSIASVASAARPGPPTTDPEAVPRGSGQDVLVVDDEPAILRAVTSLLTRLGYSAHAHQSAAHVLGCLEEGAIPAKLLLTDLSMPGMTGLELAAAAVARSPALRVVLMTGYDQGLSLEEAQQHGVSGIVSKPFTVKEIGDVLDAVLSQG